MKSANTVRSENKKSAAGAIISVLITALPVRIFYLVYTRFYTNATFWGRGNYLFTMMYAIMLILFMSVYSGYKVRQYRTRELVFSFAIAVSITNFLMYFVMCMIAREMLRVWGVLLATVAQMAVGMGLYIISRIVLPMVEPAMPMLYIRRDDAENRLAGMFDSRRSRFKVSGQISSKLNWEDMKTAISPFNAVLIGDMDPDTRREIVSYCYRTGREALMADWREYAAERGMSLQAAGEGHRFTVVAADGEETVVVASPEGAIPCETVQKFLDDFLSRHPEAEIDFIHGEDSLRTLAGKPGTVGLLLPEIDKHSFFADVERLGVLPRKTFSMGEADEKRFYMEAKRI